MTDPVDRRAQLERAWPCTPQRHTFDADAEACLCGVLSRAAKTAVPEVMSVWPTRRRVKIVNDPPGLEALTDG